MDFFYIIFSSSFVFFNPRTLRWAYIYESLYRCEVSDYSERESEREERGREITPHHPIAVFFFPPVRRVALKYFVFVPVGCEALIFVVLALSTVRPTKITSLAPIEEEEDDEDEEEEEEEEREEVKDCE